MVLVRMMIAIFDSCVGIVQIGRLLGNPFVEKMGVREGGPESPHQFNGYVSGLRERLESEHPRLCKLMDVIVALVLYADDAALPADSAEDLQLAADILE